VNSFSDAVLTLYALLFMGAPFFAIGILIAAPIMWFTFPANTPHKSRFSLLTLLPLIWLFVGIWGALFWRHWERNAPPNPDWAFYPVEAAPIAMLILSGWLFWWLNGARSFVAIFAAVNFYFLLVMCFLALMALSGDWL
jgi:hypothetical protein